jgi:hypothetical protein
MPDPIDADVDSVSSFLHQIASSGFTKEVHAHVRVWFRGQPDVNWDLAPGIYRNTIPVSTEAQRLELERHLTQDFQIESAGLLPGQEAREELYFLQQHYGLPTRLLDWTHRPLAALFFATDAASLHGAVFMIDAYDMEPTQKTGVFRGIATSRAPFFRDQINAIYDWAGTPQYHFIVPVRPDHFDRRIAYQQSCFTFHSEHAKILTKNNVARFRKYRIPASAKQPIREELMDLGMDQFAVYGDLPSLALRLKAGYRIP